MSKCLYLLCPTDCLESVINRRDLRDENYFYTSLGNSVVFNNCTVQHIKMLLKKHDIREISFVLSENNTIVLDALGKKDFLNVRGLENFYNDITRQNEHSKVSGHRNNRQFSLLSYHLNKKIKELDVELNSLHFKRIKINGKIYNRQKNIFNTIYSDLICFNKFCLN